MHTSPKKKIIELELHNILLLGITAYVVQAFETSCQVPPSRIVCFATERRSMRSLNRQRAYVAGWDWANSIFWKSCMNENFDEFMILMDSWILGDSLLLDPWIFEEWIRDSNHSSPKIHMNESQRKIHDPTHSNNCDSSRRVKYCLSF